MSNGAMRYFDWPNPIRMSDGWRGTTHAYYRSRGGEITVIAIRAGFEPNDRLDGYRAFNSKFLSGGRGTFSRNGETFVDWSAASRDHPKGEKERRTRGREATRH